MFTGTGGKRSIALWAHLLVLAFTGIVVYSNSLFVPFQFDDPINIEFNPFVRNQLTCGQLQEQCAKLGNSQMERTVCEFTIMRSVGYATFAWNFAAGGTSVLGYHIVNLLIHIANALLVYAVIILFFRTPFLASSQYAAGSRMIAFAAAFLFLTHPVQTQAVTYIVQRLTSLAALFYLASFAAYARWRLAAASNSMGGRGPSGSRSAPGHAAWAWYVLALLSAVLAMKTKEIAFTLPAALTLYEVFFFRGAAGRRLAALLPFYLTMLIIPVSLMFIAHGRPGGNGGIGDAARVLSSAGRGEYLLTELRVIVTYLRLLAFPAGQNIDYDYPLSRSLLSPGVLPSFLLLAGIAALGVLLYRRSRSGDAALRVVSFGIFWFFLALAVESSVIPIVDVIFEHRLYLPSFGMFLSGSMLFTMLVNRGRNGATARTVLYGLGLILLTALPVASYARNTVWRDETTLWEDVVRKSPGKARGYLFLANAYSRRGDRRKAMDLLSNSLRLDPANAIANFRMGVLNAEQGDHRAAFAFFDRAEAADPNLADNHFARANLYADRGEYGKALGSYEKVLQVNPLHSQAYNNRGNIFFLRGAYRDAVMSYGKAVVANPSNADAYLNRGMARAALKEFAAALDDYDTVLCLAPDNPNALMGRGAVRLAQGAYQAAIDDFTRVIALSPFTSDGYLQRGKALRSIGKRAEALADLQRSCDLGSREACVFAGRRR